MTTMTNRFAVLGVAVFVCSGALVLSGGMGCDGGIQGPNQAPAASINASSTTTSVGAQVILDGSGSSDPEGKALTYSWARAAGPYHLEMGHAAEAQATVTLQTVGEHQITLTVSDGELAGTATVTIGVEGANASRLYVSKGAAAGGDGTQSNPYNTIQGAINAASSPADVYVCEGTYDEERSNRNALLLAGRINLWGGFDCTTWKRTFTSEGMPANTSTIAMNASDLASCDVQAALNPDCATVRAPSPATSDTVLDGFAIEGPEATYADSKTVSVDAADGASGLTISTNTIIVGGSVASNSRGIFYDREGPAVVRNNIIRWKDSYAAGSFPNTDGSTRGLAIHANTAPMTDATIAYNRFYGPTRDFNFEKGVELVDVEGGTGPLSFRGNVMNIKDGVNMGENSSSAAGNSVTAILAFKLENWRGSATIEQNFIYAGNGSSLGANGIGGIAAFVGVASPGSATVRDNVISAGMGRVPMGFGRVALLGGGSILVENNTMYTGSSSDPEQVSVGVFPSGEASMDIRENIFVMPEDASAMQVAILGTSGVAALTNVSNNDFWFGANGVLYATAPQGGGDFDAEYRTVAEMEAALGAAVAAGNVSADPQFTDGSDFPAHLLPADSTLAGMGASIE